MEESLANGSQITIHPVILWVLGVVLGLVFLFKYVNMGTTEVEKLTNTARRLSRASHSVRLAHMSKELEWCKNKLAELQEQMEERDRLAIAHQRWDRQHIQQMLEQNPAAVISPVPPLIPTKKMTPKKPPGKRE